MPSAPAEAPCACLSHAVAGRSPGAGGPARRQAQGDQGCREHGKGRPPGQPPLSGSPGSQGDASERTHTGGHHGPSRVDNSPRSWLRPPHAAPLLLHHTRPACGLRGGAWPRKVWGARQSSSPGVPAMNHAVILWGPYFLVYKMGIIFLPHRVAVRAGDDMSQGLGRHRLESADGATAVILPCWTSAIPAGPASSPMAPSTWTLPPSAAPDSRSPWDRQVLLLPSYVF